MPSEPLEASRVPSGEKLTALAPPACPPSERMVLTLRAIRESMPYLLIGSPEVVDRRFALLRKDNDERNRLMLEKLALAESRDEGN